MTRDGRPRLPPAARAAGTLATLAPAAALLLLAGCGQIEAQDPVRAPAAGTEPAPVAVASAAARAEALPTVLEVTGTLMADAQTEIASEIDGRIVEVAVERGALVGAGAVVARLNDQDATSQLREAEATEAQTTARLGLAGDQPFDPRATPEAQRARAVLERVEADFQRYARLVEQGLVSRSEYDARRADAATARAQLEETLNQMRQLSHTREAQRARVAMARKALGDTVIRAPYAGLIAEKLLNVGDYAKKGTRVATLVRVDPLRVELTIPEAAVAAVRKGQRVAFAVQSQPGRTFAGTIAYVGPALRAESRALVVEAVLPNPSGTRTPLQPGLFVTARIELPADAPGVVVPLSAVRTEGGVSRLFVLKADRAELRYVQLGRRLDQRADGLVELTRGVAAGERVATSDLERLADGLPVSDRGGR